MIAALADWWRRTGTGRHARRGVAVTEVVRPPASCTLDEPGVGFTRVAHATAVGKVPGRVPLRHGRRLPRRLATPACTPHTLRTGGRSSWTSPRPASGYALQLEELAIGCRCVAAPVLDAEGGTVASIGLSVPVEASATKREINRRCRETAAQASRAPLGFSGAAARPPRDHG